MNDFEHIFDGNITIQFYLEIYADICYHRESGNKKEISETLLNSVKNEDELNKLEYLIQELDNIDNDIRNEILNSGEYDYFDLEDF